MSDEEEKWPCDDPDCVWCTGSLPMRHPYSGPPILYTTVVIAKHDKTNDIKVFDLGEMEMPSGQYTPINAYTCTKEEAIALKDKTNK